MAGQRHRSARAGLRVATCRPGPGGVLPLAAVLWALLAVLLGYAAPALAQPKFPALTDGIVDEAGIVKPADRSEILRMLKALEEKSSDQIRIYTTRTLQGYPIEEFGYQLGRAWGIGQKDKNNGIVLIVAPNERKVRIEVGRGLEPQMTDLMSGLIINNVILPAFRRGDFSGGIRAGVQDIRDVLLGDAEAVKERARGAVKRTQGSDNADLLIFALFVGFFLLVVWLQMREARRHPQQRARYRRNDGDVIVVPGGWGGSSSWPSGGGGDSGGSWGGGGGDFGGGGASGSW